MTTSAHPAHSPADGRRPRAATASDATRRAQAPQGPRRRGGASAGVAGSVTVTLGLTLGLALAAPSGAAQASPSAGRSATQATATASRAAARSAATSARASVKAGPVLDPAELARRAVRAPHVPAGTTTASGVVTRIWLDPAQGETSASGEESATWVVGDAGRVQVPSAALQGVPDGSTVEVDLAATTAQRAPRVRKVVRAKVLRRAAAASRAGVEAGTTALSPAATGVATQAATTAAPAPIAHTTTLVLVRAAGAAADTMTLSTLKTRMNEAAAYWSAQSRGKVAITTSKTYTNASTGDWLTTRAGCADYYGLWNEVAAKVGFTAADRNHLVLYVTTAATGCSAGLGTVGSSLGSGGYLYVQGNLTGLVAHELGHNFSLGHSNGLQCNGTADGVATTTGTGTSATTTWTNGCATKGYRDYYDVMGVSWANLGTLSTFHARRLGVLPASQLGSVTSPSWVTLAPVGATSGIVSTEVRDPSGTVYTMEYRAAVGADAWLASNARGLRPGVVLRRANPAATTQTLLLDASPSATTAWASDWDEPLGVGAPITSASGRLRVEVTSATATQAVVSVTMDGVAPAARTTTSSTPAVTTVVRSGVARVGTAPGVALAPAGSAVRGQAEAAVAVVPAPSAQLALR
ncbi:MAG: hypothetical protein U0Q15_15640 [Kineosporiaceae bacterium]